MYSETKFRDENQSNLVMCRKAKCYGKNRPNLVMYSERKFHDENQSNVVIYSKAKCHGKN